MNMSGSIHQEATESLIADFRASKVSFTMWGTKKALDDVTLSTAADAFGADIEFMGASKKLINTKAKAWRKVTGIKSRICRAWHECTLPYPEPGLRLMREDHINTFAASIAVDRTELLAAVDELNEQYYTLRSEARDKLGSLYRESDYPMSLLGLFDVAWEFPNVTPPDYMRDLNPALFEQERLRMVSRFDEAVALAEQAFIGEFEGLVSHLAERLTGSTDDGKAKMFKDSTVTNLSDFFQKFSTLSVRSNKQLDELVQTAQKMVSGVDANSLKPINGSTTGAQDVLRKHIAESMSTIGTALQGMMTVKPKRRIFIPQGEPSAA